MEQYGNASYNVESVLRKNIVDSEYFRDTCGKLGSWSEVVDQIYYDVTSVEPWMSGNARGASTAFCLLYRLFTLQISEQEVKDLITHMDSPYIRAVGFLYIRYVANPRTIWQWIQPYVRDEERFSPSPEPHGKEVTMGEYVRDVFLELYYFETIFPRVPKPQQDDFVSKLTSMGLPSRAVGNGGQGGGDRRGIEEANRRPASVKASLSVAFGQRAPNRPTAREEGRGLGAGMKGALGAAGAPRPGATHASRDEDPREREADRSREHKHDSRPREHERNGHASGSRPREGDQHRDRHRHGERSHRDAREPREDRPHKRPRSPEREQRQGSSRHADHRDGHSHRRDYDRR